MPAKHSQKAGKGACLPLCDFNKTQIFLKLFVGGILCNSCLMYNMSCSTVPCLPCHFVMLRLIVRHTLPMGCGSGLLADNISPLFYIKPRCCTTGRRWVDTVFRHKQGCPSKKKQQQQQKITLAMPHSCLWYWAFLECSLHPQSRLLGCRNHIENQRICNKKNPSNNNKKTVTCNVHQFEHYTSCLCCIFNWK